MKEAHNSNKSLAPYRFWDRFITFNLLGVAGICFNLIAIYTGSVDQTYFVSLMVGLLCGQGASCIAHTGASGSPRRKGLSVAYFSLTTGLFFLLIFVFRSARVATGFLIGLGITLFFGAALGALVRRSIPEERSG